MNIGTFFENLATTQNCSTVVTIYANSYVAGGVNTPQKTVRVDQDFITPPGHITNANTAAVLQKFGDTPNGLYARDLLTNYYYLYALGQGEEFNAFETLDPNLLPPIFGIKKQFDEILNNPNARARFDFGTTIRRALPRLDRYLNPKKDLSAFMAPGVALTHASGWELQAVAQLLGDPELATRLFGITGNFYADLLTSAQWGLMAMEGILNYMTRPSYSSSEPAGLTNSSGKKLRAHGLNNIVPATDFPPLPNGVLPNVVLDLVKDFVRDPNYDHFQIIRGGSSWKQNNASSSFFQTGRSDYTTISDNDTVNLGDFIGARVGFVSRENT